MYLTESLIPHAVKSYGFAMFICGILALGASAVLGYVLDVNVDGLPFTLDSVFRGYSLTATFGVTVFIVVVFPVYFIMWVRYDYRKWTTKKWLYESIREQP